MKRVSDKVVMMDVTGYVFPWNGAQPVYVDVEGAIFLPLFSSAEKLREMMMKTAVAYVSIKQVVGDQMEFLTSFPPDLGVRIMVDPWVTDEGNTRFKELILARTSDGTSAAELNDGDPT